MNELGKIVSRIDELQSKIESYGPLNLDLAKRIQHKFRLDWNYYSNAMEGNSLTRIETKQLMMDNVTIDGKPFKDIAEMRGHDSEVLEIFKLGKGEVRISESRIKQMHKTIMHEDNPDKKPLIGKWKTTENYLFNYKNERIDFIPPEEVGEAIHSLLNKTNAEIDSFYNNKKKKVKHISLIAFEFHLDYLKIHPFYDGNGRTGRLLMNLLLISFGHPPIVLNDKTRKTYYKLLADVQAYGANPDDFYAFLGKLLTDSQQFVLDAIEGKNIEDEDEVDKEILLFKSSLKGEKENLREKDGFLIAELYKKNICLLFETFIEKHRQFDDLFLNKRIENCIDNKWKNTDDLEYFNKWTEYQYEINDIKIKYKDGSIQVSKLIDINNSFPEFNVTIGSMTLKIHFLGFTKNGSKAFDEYTELTIQFDQYKYGLRKDRFIDERFEKLYTQCFTNDEIKTIVNEKAKEFLDKLKKRTEPFIL